MIPEAIQQKLIAHRGMIIALAILLTVILLISFSPTYIARHLISNTLDDFGIEHDGIKTIKINLWKREVWAGPVRFRAGDSDPGQLGEVGIKVHIFPVFQKHAWVERVLIRGIDIVIARTESNAITLNGIPLNQFTPTTETPESPKPEKESKPWGAGVGNFELQDSRLVLTRKTGATLSVEIRSLQLSDFASWQPDDPGSFELNARINNIELDLKGEARPFAEQITVKVDSNARDASLDKIIEFIGPINLERYTGVVHSSTQNEITLFVDTGHLEGRSVGKISLADADYAQVDRFAFTTEQADVDLDVRYSLSENDELQLDGYVALGMVSAGAKLPGDDPITIGSINATLVDLSASRGAGENIKFAAKPKMEIDRLTYSGNIQLSMDVLTDVLRLLQSISTKKQINKEETGLDKWSGDEVTLPKSDIAIKQINASVSKFEMNSANGKVTLDIVLENEVNGLKVTANERRTNLESVRVKLDTLRLNSGEGKTGLTLTGSSAVNRVSVKGPNGKASVDAVKTSQNVDLKINRGDIALQGSVTTDIEETRLHANKTGTLPQATFEVGKVSANIQNATFSMMQQKINWQVESGASIDSASASYADGKMSSANIQRLEWRGARADQNLNIVTETLTISGLKALVTRQFINGLIGDKPGQETAAIKESRAVDEEDAETREVKITSVKPPEDKPGAFNLKLDHLELLNGAQLRFLDQQVLPPILVDLHIKKAEVRGIDSRNPESNARANLVATINEFTHSEFSGKGNNIGPKVNMEITSSLKNMELPPYSSYAAEFAGLNLQSGQFNTDINVKAYQGVLDGAIKLHIKDLEFTPLSATDAERLSEKAGVPIETAVKLLKDPKGNIDLKLPVTGSVVEPSIEVRSAIGKAVGNTLRAVMPHTLIGSALSSIREGDENAFKPILFNPGSSDLNGDAIKYLDELAALLKKRPTLSLDICGRATPDDFKAITLKSLKLPPDAKPELVEKRQRLINTHAPNLVELATERTRAVRRYLINDKRLNAAQVGECRLGFNADDSEPPRVVVTL